MKRILIATILTAAALQAGPMRLAVRTAKVAPKATVHYVGGIAKAVGGLVKAVVW